jgi:hypothetical protein
MKPFLRICLAFVSLSLPAVASAQALYQIDLGTDQAGGNWIDLASGVDDDNELVDFNTGIAVPDSNVSNLFTSFNGASSNNAGVDFMPESVWSDGGSANFNGGGVFVNGLPMGNYRVEVVAWYALPQWQGLYTVNGAPADRTRNGTDVPEIWSALNDGLTSENWLIWDNVVIDAETPQLSALALIFGQGSLVNMNALRITEIPEPATAPALLALIGAVTAVRRRK